MSFPPRPPIGMPPVGYAYAPVGMMPMGLGMMPQPVSIHSIGSMIKSATSLVRKE